VGFEVVRKKHHRDVHMAKLIDLQAFCFGQKLFLSIPVAAVLLENRLQFNRALNEQIFKGVKHTHYANKGAQ